MSARRMRAHVRPLLGALGLTLLWSTGASAAEERTDGAIPPTPLPAPVLTTGLSRETPLPVDVVPWAALAAPPAHGEAGGMLLQGGGGGPRFRYYGLDALGSVRVVFDAAGAVVSRADYEPFGAAAATTTGPQPREQYTGHERDGEVGVDYLGARLYLAAHGRMPSVDPLYAGAVGSPQRWNRYAYASNSPLVNVDPDGRCDQPFQFDVTVCGWAPRAEHDPSTTFFCSTTIIAITARRLVKASIPVSGTTSRGSQKLQNNKSLSAKKIKLNKLARANNLW